MNGGALHEDSGQGNGFGEKGHTSGLISTESEMPVIPPGGNIE